MADGNVVGSAEFELRATRKKLKDDLAQSERDLKGFVDKAEKTANTGANNIGSGIQKMTRMATTSVLALTAVLAAAATFAFQAGKASLKMADDMADAARRIGIGTTALQEWRYVARKTGEDAAAVDADLERFATKFAQAQAGISKEAFKPFQRLIFSQDDLRRMKDADEALEQVMDRIGALKNPNDRQAIAEQIGLGSLSTAAREGSEEIERLRGEAAALGFVMDAEVIRKGADAQEQLEDLSQVIGIQMAEAFISLSDEVLNFTSQIADAIKALGDFIEKSQIAKRVTGVGFGDALGMAGTPMGLAKGLFKIGQFAVNGPNLVDTDALEDLAAGTGRHAPPRPRRRPRGAPDLADLPGRTQNSRADHAAEREARRAERVEQEIFRARQRALGIYDQEAVTVQQRFDLEQAQVKLEREAEAKELESRLARKDITKAEFDQLKLIQTQTAALEDRVASDILARDLADERMANERLLADLTADLVSLQIGAARSAGERLALERQLLEITQNQRRNTLQVSLDRNTSLTPEQRQQVLDDNKRRDQMEQEAIARANMTPLQQWRDQSLRDAREVQEAYENVAARGLDALNDGIVDAIMNSRDLGDVFSKVARGIMADLLAISVRRSITEPLANMLFGGEGGGKGGGSGWVGKAISAVGGWFGGGRAFGGPVQAGMAYRVGEHGPETLMMPRNGFVVPDRAFGGGQGGPLSGGSGGRAGATVIQNWNVRDYDSFRRSSRQIARDTRRGLDRS